MSQKRCKTTNNKQIFRLFHSMGQSFLFSNLFSTQQLIAIIVSWRIMVRIKCQIFVYYHVYLLQDIKFTGYVANHFDTRKFTTLWIKQKQKKKKKKNDIDKTFRALKMIAWSFSAHPIEKQLIAHYTLPVKLNWRVFKLIKIKICF